MKEVVELCHLGQSRSYRHHCKKNASSCANRGDAGHPKLLSFELHVSVCKREEEGFRALPAFFFTIFFNQGNENLQRAL